MDSNQYNKDYFENGMENNLSCYSNYRWIPDLTIPMVARMVEYLGLNRHQLILDFGCAKGYVVKSFYLMNFRRCYGVDISEYAISQAPEETKPHLFLMDEDTDPIPMVDGIEYDWVVSKDVLEHVDYSKIDIILNNLRLAAKNAFFVVPLGDGKRFNVPEYEHDVTHKIRESLSWWENRFIENGFSVKLSSYRVKYIKEKWAKFKNGNGFFVLE